MEDFLSTLEADSKQQNLLNYTHTLTTTVLDPS